MTDVDRHRQPPDSDALNRLAATVTPGSEIVDCTPLTGGAENGMFLLRISPASGPVLKLVLRRHGDTGRIPVDKRIRSEWNLLRLLQDWDIPAPRPVLNDSDGEMTGQPSLLISYLDGEPDLTPNDPGSWARELAWPLARLHSRAEEARESGAVAFLPDLDETVRRILREGPSDEKRRHPDAVRVWNELRSEATRIEPSPRTVCHGDYHTGNVIFSGGRVQGIIDWDAAAIYEPGYDLGQMRMDLCLLGRFEEADIFISEYERLSASPIRNLRFYQLLAALRAMANTQSWLAGWNDFGVGLAHEQVLANLSRYIDQVLG